MDEDPFGQWFASWLGHRGDFGPVGWYKSQDLKEAFNAGYTRGVVEVVARTEALVQAIKDQD